MPVLQKTFVVGLGGEYRFFPFFIAFLFELYSIYVGSITDSRVRRRSLLCYYVGHCCDNVHLTRRCRKGNSGGPCTHGVDGGADITQ